MEKAKKNTKAKLPIRKYLILILIALVACSGVTFAKYTGRVEGNATATVALFASDFEIIDLPVESLYPGCRIELPVTVKNYNGNDPTDMKKVSQVTQSYTVSAESLTNSLPISLQWLAPDEAAGQEEELLTETGGIFFPTAGKAYVHTLVITWPTTNEDGTDNSALTNPDLMYEIDVIRITVDAEQLD